MKYIRNLTEIHQKNYIRSVTGKQSGTPKYFYSQHKFVHSITYIQVPDILEEMECLSFHRVQRILIVVAVVFALFNLEIRLVT